MRLLPTLAGILLIGAEGYVVGDAMWEPAPCAEWAGNRCVDSAMLVPLDRCAPYRLVVNSEPKPDRMNPANRVRVWIVRDGYMPADSNLDGLVTVADAAMFMPQPWDFNNDGTTDGADVASYLAAFSRGCPTKGAR